MNRYKENFPIFRKNGNIEKLSYLDSAATTQKPEIVIKAVSDFLAYENATVHRGVYSLSQQATEKMDNVREKVANFIGAERSSEIIFTKGATESINLIANSYGLSNIKVGDEIIVTEMEHHANIIPWQVLCERTGAKLKVVPIKDNGELDCDEFKRIISEKTKIVAVTHVSNVLGTINPVKRIAEVTHEHGAIIVVDGAQAVPHKKVDVKDIDCDFYVFSAHKMYGPTGVGVLYGKRELLEKMPPYQTGGSMIEYCSFEKTTYADIPLKFEAGTPPIAEIMGLGAAISYINNLGYDVISDVERSLLFYTETELRKIPEVKIFGDCPKKAAVISFEIENVHAHDVGSFLDEDNICVRVGHHCAHPLMKRLGVTSTVRASFGVYNTKQDADRFLDGIRRVIDFFS